MYSKTTACYVTTTRLDIGTRRNGVNVFSSENKQNRLVGCNPVNVFRGGDPRRARRCFFLRIIIIVLGFGGRTNVCHSQGGGVPVTYRHY